MLTAVLVLLAGVVAVVLVAAPVVEVVTSVQCTTESSSNRYRACAEVAICMHK
jgi:hypothetical protein